MSLTNRKPRGTAFEGRAAGQGSKPLARLATAFYHGRGGRASDRRTVMVDTPVGQRTVGHVEEGVFRKQVRKGEHLLRILDAWGFQAELLPQLRAEGVMRVEVYDAEEGVTYAVALDVIEARGVRRDFGHGEQVFLPRKFFERSDAGRDDAPQPQLSLFGAVSP